MYNISLKVENNAWLVSLQFLQSPLISHIFKLDVKGWWLQLKIVESYKK